MPADPFKGRITPVNAPMRTLHRFTKPGGHWAEIRERTNTTFRAIEYIVKAQASNGSWGYSSGTAGDTSIVGWQIQALKSAQMCKEMETLGRADTTEGAAVILIDMEQEFQAVRHSLSAILEKEI